MTQASSPVPLWTLMNWMGTCYLSQYSGLSNPHQNGPWSSAHIIAFPNPQAYEPHGQMNHSIATSLVHFLWNLCIAENKIFNRRPKPQPNIWWCPCMSYLVESMKFKKSVWLEICDLKLSELLKVGMFRETGRTRRGKSGNNHTDAEISQYPLSSFS